MSREIRLPRIWDKICKEMMYAKWETGDVNGKELSLYMYTLKDGINHSSLSWVLHQPVFEVMWPTGLKDKNGVEIYESDIVNWKGMEYGDTQSYPEDLIDTVGEIECCYGSNEWLRNSPNQCEVIGNIHENPELLK